MTRISLVLGLFLSAFSLAVTASAREVVPELTPEQEWRVARLEALLKCPVCKNQALASSTSFLAEEMKRQIRAWVREGRSDQEILDYYVARYGAWILMEPPRQGFAWLAWLLPLGGVLVALVAVGWALRRWARTSSPTLAESDELPELSPEARAAVAAALEEGDAP